MDTIVAKCPGLAGTVPEFGPMSRLCPGLPDFAALSRNPARLHKWKCGTSINSVYRTLSNTTYGKKIISILKNARFSGKGRQSLHIIIIINIMRICKNRISYVRLDHTLYSINYGIIEFQSVYLDV